MNKVRYEFAMMGAPAIDCGITLCDDAANETCPVWPGKPIKAHWGLPDPASAQGGDVAIDAAFAETYEVMKASIEAFLRLVSQAPDGAALELGVRATGTQRGR